MEKKFWSTTFMIQVNRSTKVTMGWQDTTDCFCVVLRIKITFKLKATRIRLL